MLIGTYLISKVLVQRLLFKPYKIRQHFANAGDFYYTQNFKINSLVLGYTLIALLTDHTLDLFKTEIEKKTGKPLTTSKQESKTRRKIFQDLLPIDDDYVEYADFEACSK